MANTPAGFIPLINAAGISAKNGSSRFFKSARHKCALNQNYKALQYLYVAKKFNKTKISACFLADQFGKYILDSVKNTGVPMKVIYMANALTNRGKHPLHNRLIG
jgi:hypothetical protein